MSKTKQRLSPKMAEVLRSMCRGARIRWNHYSGTYNMATPEGEPHVNITVNTIDALINRGYITVVRFDYHDITDVGRAAVEGVTEDGR